ncbi:hypothetical protein ACIBL3_46405 [Kribbella sp. NPDC050124]|uniref:hypothetical protein n=1 Tax=Kribbella sp. NPDC050124 TaxID=3364114 RepID=UPI0037BC0E96
MPRTSHFALGLLHPAVPPLRQVGTARGDARRHLECVLAGVQDQAGDEVVAEPILEMP